MKRKLNSKKRGAETVGIGAKTVVIYFVAILTEQGAVNTLARLIDIL